MPKPASATQKIHFEDFGGAEFERLVFAYHVRAGWTDISWYGQTGSDMGRDIVGNEPARDGKSRRAIVQCVNRGSLTQAKAEDDMKKALAAPGVKIKAFKFVARGTISPTRRDAIDAAARTLGIRQTTIWSGVDFEEHLRLIGEDLLRRFFNSEAFPDDAEGLRRFADDYVGLTDQDILQQMAATLDRPAFHTRFRDECSLPAFHQAIEDTISALNTGIWKTRNGDEIRRIPSLHHLRNPEAKTNVARASRLLDELRKAFVAGLRSGSVKPCGCKQPDCPVFFIEPATAERLDRIKSEALDAFRTAHPSFHVELS